MYPTTKIVCGESVVLARDGEFLVATLQGKEYVYYAEYHEAEKHMLLTLEHFLWEKEWKRQRGEESFFQLFAAAIQQGETTDGFMSLTQFKSLTELSIKGKLITEGSVRRLRNQYEKLFEELYRGKHTTRI